MSHVLMCRGSSYSKASSSRMRCSSIAVYVPCCDTFGMSCLRHIACSFLRTHFLHILRSVSICIFAQRSITELISAVLFLASASSHRHFSADIVSFPIMLPVYRMCSFVDPTGSISVGCIRILYCQPKSCFSSFVSRRRTPHMWLLC